MARALIIIGQTILTIFAVRCSFMLYRQGYRMEMEGVALAALVFLVLGLMYPERQRYRGEKLKFLRRRLSADLALFTAGMALVIAMVNYELPRAFKAEMDEQSYQAVSVALHNGSRPAEELSGHYDKVSTAQPREWRKNVRNWLKEQYQKTEEKNTNLPLFILIFIGMQVLSILLAILCCNIACSGAEVLALFVLFAGLGGILLLGTWLLRKLLPQEKKKRALGMSVLFLLGGFLLTAILF